MKNQFSRKSGPRHYLEMMHQTGRIGRNVLSREQARQIFSCKALRGREYKPTHLAKLYGITSKTVRDIWLGRTWHWATFDMQGNTPSLETH